MVSSTLSIHKRMSMAEYEDQGRMKLFYNMNNEYNISLLISIEKGIKFTSSLFLYKQLLLILITYNLINIKIKIIYL